MDIRDIVVRARRMNGSDIHISEGMKLSFRVNGALVAAPEQPPASEMRQLIFSMTPEDRRERIEAGGDDDFAFSLEGVGRQRVNVYHCSMGLAATVRLLNSEIPTLAELRLPETISALSRLPRGLVLVTGPTGSGKSTTLAALVAEINRTRPEHIITVEDPIEYIYGEGTAIIHQREVGRDVKDFATALRSALREDPDVILVGEMRDHETVSAAVTAAETGHLVLSTLHTTGAAQTIDRIINSCPAQAQSELRIQLAGVLKAAVTQCLIPTAAGDGRCPATEILLGTDAVQNIIRENKCHMLGAAMQSGAAAGMHTLNTDLLRLVKTGLITKERALAFSNDRRELAEMM